MTPDWRPLDAELDRWRTLGLTLPLWWRDDDAVTRTPALERLTDLARTLDMPVHLAVIPARADAALAEFVARHPLLIPVVHGWAHASHAPACEKKAEFGAHRPLPAMQDEAVQGLARLSGLFRGRVRPMFVPPWNRIAEEVASGLPAAGYAMLSTFTPRKAPDAAPGLLQINTHLDPIAWKAGRGLVPPEALIAQLAADLGARRAGRADGDEPYGILTHHLAHDDAIWDFTGALFRRLLRGPARRWTAPASRNERDTTT
ncbi:MAG: polysaccharide deacetylase family protein [Rhodobacteraceae bacterium]|nr:polysaccharide deacetylase family protein [Paracoccaceae bacterium]